uniref:Uncharacterized protein n=1 Tax=Myoviridae sp. ctPuP5 TaxID=2823543 RepID=A0A8S5L9Y5_9CAUD|nr:MAG TPA: hypothetical protein [Myoviridae sp. ctPuP5]
MAAGIQDRLLKLAPYNPGFNLFSGQIIIHVTYKPNWRVLDSYDEAVKIARDDNNQFQYYYYASTETDFNRIFDVIDTTVKFNNEAELKRQLLVQKVNELQKLFESEDLEVLQTLEFKIKKKKVRAKKEKVVEDKQIETEETNLEVQQENEINDNKEIV